MITQLPEAFFVTEVEWLDFKKRELHMCNAKDKSSPEIFKYHTVISRGIILFNATE